MILSELKKQSGHFILFALVLLLFQACTQQPKTPVSQTPQPVEKLEYFETGNIQRRYTEVNGKKEGKMIDYYPDGTLLGERWFTDDKQIGRTNVYYKSGRLKEVQYYENGLKQGGDTLWYEDGKIEFATTFLNGKKNGVLRKWSPDGKIVFEASYNQDTLSEIQGKKLEKKYSVGKGIRKPAN